jgi:signal transduction histidine kinase
LFVADDGPGVALDDPEAVFDRGVSTGEGGVGRRRQARRRPL